MLLMKVLPKIQTQEPVLLHANCTYANCVFSEPKGGEKLYIPTMAPQPSKDIKNHPPLFRRDFILDENFKLQF